MNTEVNNQETQVQEVESHCGGQKAEASVEVNRNENGYDHTQDNIGVAANFDVDAMDDKLNEIAQSDVIDDGKISTLMEVLEEKLSPREIAFMAANDFASKLQPRNPLAGLMAMFAEGASQEEE